MADAILVIAKFIALPGKGDELKQLLVDCISDSRAEEGNVHYELYHSVEEAGVFLFHETWRDQQAFELHGQTPHFQTMLKSTRPLLASEPEVKIING